MDEVKDAYFCLKRHRKYLTVQQYKTIKGQIKAGDINGAMNGLDRLLRRKGA